MKNTKPQALTRNEIESLNQGLISLGQNILAYAQRLIDAIDRDPETVSKMIAANPKADRGILRRLERVGRRQLHHELFFAHSAATSAVAKLPYSVQEQAVSSFIPLVEVINGTQKTSQKTLSEIPPDKVSQVFDLVGKKIRQPAEQKQIIAAMTPAKPCRWRVADGKLYVFQNPLTLAEVESAIKEMKHSAICGLETEIKNRQINRQP